MLYGDNSSCIRRRHPDGRWKGPGFMTQKRLGADFDVVDDVVSAALSGRLRESDPIVLVSADRLAPLVEMAIASRASPQQFANVSCEGCGADAVRRALDEEAISGNGYGENLGVLPMTRDENTQPGGDRYEQWMLRFQNAAAAIGFQKPFARQLAAALGEISDNVFLHSRTASVALAGFWIRENSVEFVVADSGIGVLDSLKTNPVHAHLKDAGQALTAIVSEGATRFEAGTGHGQGIKQFLRAIAGQHGHVRFRSGDHALTLSGDLTAGVGTLRVAGKGQLRGLTVSVQCLLPATSGSRSSP